MLVPFLLAGIVYVDLFRCPMAKQRCGKSTCWCSPEFYGALWHLTSFLTW